MPNRMFASDTHQVQDIAFHLDKRFLSATFVNI